jgi:hypothetical protein
MNLAKQEVHLAKQNREMVKPRLGMIFQVVERI